MDPETKLVRRDLLRRAGIGVGALALGGVALPSGALAASTPAELGALNLLLRINRLEFAFYGEAVTKAKIDGDLLQFARVTRLQERAHVRLLNRLLAGQAEAQQTYNFGTATTDSKKFADATRRLEDLATKAQVGLAARFTDRAMAAQLTRIMAVDARHASWLASLLGGIGENSPSPDALEAALSEAAINQRFAALGFAT